MNSQSREREMKREREIERTEVEYTNNNSIKYYGWVGEAAEEK